MVMATTQLLRPTNGVLGLTVKNRSFSDGTNPKAHVRLKECVPFHLNPLEDDPGQEPVLPNRSALGRASYSVIQSQETQDGQDAQDRSESQRFDFRSTHKNII